MKKSVLVVIMLAASVAVQAREIVARMYVEETFAPASGMTVMVLTTQGNKLGDGEETDTDGTYLLHNAPESPYLVVYGTNGTMNSYYVETPVDSLSIAVHPKYVPLRVGEVEVSADNRYMAANKTVYIPTKRDKKMARGGGSLVQAMGISSLMVDPMSESISTASGESVAKFIDYIPATEKDIANLRPMEVQKVELLESPTDPRFGGARHVLNFVLVKYEYGGYTYLNARQFLSSIYGNYYGSSRFTKGKMTYDASAGFTYGNYTHEGMEETGIYHFPDLDLTKTMQSDEYKIINKSGYGTFRATYASDKALVTNTVGITVSRTPDNDRLYSTSFDPCGIFSNGMEHSSNRHSSVSPSWSGSYLWYLPKQYSITVAPSFAYGHHTRDVLRITPDADIFTASDNNNLRGSLQLTAQKQFGKHTVRLKGWVSEAWDELTNSGTVGSRSIYNELGLGFGPEYQTSIGNLWLKALAYIQYAKTRFNKYHKSQTSPTFELLGSYTLKNKHNFSFAFQLMQMTVPVNEQMPAFVLKSQIDASMGNEALKKALDIPINLSYTWFASKKVNLSLWGKYEYLHHPISNIYYPVMYNEAPLMVGTYENCGVWHSVSYGGNVSVRLFDNSLVLNGNIQGATTSRRGRVDLNNTELGFGANVSYSLKNFYGTVAYTSESRNHYNLNYSKSPAYYYLMLGWSNGDLNVSAMVSNPFVSNYNSIFSRFQDLNYLIMRQQYSDSYHRQFSVRLVYSFSYGKKVQRVQDIGKLEGTDSGIL